MFIYAFYKAEHKTYSCVKKGVKKLLYINSREHCLINAFCDEFSVITTGSPAPGPVPKDHLRLYSMRFCPFAQRTRLVLNAKGIM